MIENEPRWGADLRLLDNVFEQSDRSRGDDLATTRRRETGQIDLDRMSTLDNLQQALLLRFLTQQGELTHLGHPNYGSRLHELIGELNTESTRNRAKMYTLIALADEPRVAQVLSVDVVTDAIDRGRINITVRLLALHADTPVNLVFPFFLGGAAA